MGQNFTPDEFGQDKIEIKLKTKSLKPRKCFEIRSRLSFQSNQQASTESRDRQEIA